MHLCGHFQTRLTEEGRCGRGIGLNNKKEKEKRAWQTLVPSPPWFLCTSCGKMESQPQAPYRHELCLCPPQHNGLCPLKPWAKLNSCSFKSWDKYLIQGPWAGPARVDTWTSDFQHPELGRSNLHHWVYDHLLGEWLGHHLRHVQQRPKLDTDYKATKD